MANKKQTVATSKKVATVKKEEAVNTPKVDEVITEAVQETSQGNDTPVVEEVITEAVEESSEETETPVIEETLVTDKEIEASKKKVAKAALNVEKATAALEKANTVLENEELLLKALEDGKPIPFYENQKKRKFRFSKTAPKTMNLQGKNYSQEEIINTAELMDVLIDGNSSFVEPIY